MPKKSQENLNPTRPHEVIFAHDPNRCLKSIPLMDGLITPLDEDRSVCEFEGIADSDPHKNPTMLQIIEGINSTRLSVDQNDRERVMQILQTELEIIQTCYQKAIARVNKF